MKNRKSHIVALQVLYGYTYIRFYLIDMPIVFFIDVKMGRFIEILINIFYNFHVGKNRDVMFFRNSPI